MSTLKFKTNINCSNCLAKVTPFLNAKQGIQKWEVDIDNPAKILTVETASLTAEEVIKEVKKTGFTIEQLN